jgi:hypothetical protein
MRETAILRDVINGVIKPGRAIGRVTIDLLDPITGKVRNRVSNPNHVFEDALFSGSAYDWITSMSGQYTLLTDNATAVDEDLPFVLGNIVAYGIPSQASSGTYRGAYNAANQVLAAITTTSARWKFQYDFTTAQANGTIKCAGLSNQYVEGGRNHLSGYRASPYGNNSYTNDGRYTYVCSTAGVITKRYYMHHQLLLMYQLQLVQRVARINLLDTLLQLESITYTLTAVLLALDICMRFLIIHSQH